MAGKYNLRVDFDKTKKLKAKNVFNRPGVAGAVL